MRVVIVYPASHLENARRAIPAAEALSACFRRLGWKIENVKQQITDEPDLVAGWGWRAVMADAWKRWPDRVLHVDGAFWSRYSYVKLALGGRWSAVDGRDYSDDRLRQFNVTAAPSRKRGNRVLIIGMSAKAAKSWGMNPEAWERQTAERLLEAGASVTYRPKPQWTGSRPIDGCGFQHWARVPITQALAETDAVATHHSNVAIEALAVGLPVYAATGPARDMSAARIEWLPGVTAPSQKARHRFLCEMAWHQWTFKELASGAWLKPPAPLAGHPIFGGA